MCRTDMASILLAQIRHPLATPLTFSEVECVLFAHWRYIPTFGIFNHQLFSLKILILYCSQCVNAIIMIVLYAKLGLVCLFYFQFRA